MFKERELQNKIDVAIQTIEQMKSYLLKDFAPTPEGMYSIGVYNGLEMAQAHLQGRNTDLFDIGMFKPSEDEKQENKKPVGRTKQSGIRIIGNVEE